MLSSRGQANADQLDIPWRFAKGTTYDVDANPDGLVAFASSENALMRGEIEDFVNKNPIPSKVFRYAYLENGGPLPGALATHINEYFEPHQRVKEEDIKVTAATTALHDILAFSLAAPGEGILTSRPHYGRFDIDFANKADVKLVTAETNHETCFDEGVVDAFEDALVRSEKDGVKIRALLIVNPHNPLGRCYPKPTLLALLHFCTRHTIHLISDEIYACSVFSNPKSPSAPPFTSILSLNPTGIIDPNLIHATYGLSKDFSSGGLVLGALTTRNEALKKAVDAVADRFHGVSGPSIYLASAMLQDRSWVRKFINTSRGRVADAYVFTTTRLDEIGIKYFEGGNAGFFLWVDFSPYLPPEQEGVSGQEREIALAQRFVDGGVFLHPGEEKSVRVGWFRLVFTAVERRVLEEGLRRVEGVVRGLVW